MSFGLAILRAVIGGLFIGHGLQKLLGKFGGHGIEGTAGGFEQMGLRPGKAHATAAGVAETAGGALLVLGLATPVAASALTGTMAVAVKKVHLSNGPWAAEGGYEYNAVLVAALFALTANGPGGLSLDNREWGTAWAIAELAAGVAGAAALLAFAGKGGTDGDLAGDQAGDAAAPEPVASAN